MPALPPVRTRTERLAIPTYRPAPPDRNPMFLEKRVYQGSSGRVYPLPFTDRIAETASPRKWKVIWLENEFLEVMILPEIGGRIHALKDKTNGYDLIYRQPVIKPALVGLAGPWISGGIEFNWPQHHRPATFLPVDTQVEPHADGSITVWCSDHDPMARMKGMHGVCLHPGCALLELKVRAYNRTPFVQTFLWWANVATRVHEAYQSFFPPDVQAVADHARRSMSEYPLAQGRYYGVDYGARARTGIPREELPTQFVPVHRPDPATSKPACAPNDLSFYANIPVPTSYMCMGSREDFFGGYDHKARAGIVHVADHRIAPGKKQWTWGNHAFGYAWDRHLTDPEPGGEYPPYIELMAGVFTDNQPDFSFLRPGETKAWSQHWYPIQQIGPAHHANLEAAVSLTIGRRRFRLGVAVTRRFPGACIRLERPDGAAAEWDRDLAPDQPFVLDSPQARRPWRIGVTTLRVFDRNDREIIRWAPQPAAAGALPPPATEPPPPADIPGNDELYVTGLHLEQYRHATRCPTRYWREALRRDPLDARCNHALGRWHLRRGEFEMAEHHCRRAIERLTRRNANPYDGEPHYTLGLCLRYQMDGLEARAGFRLPRIRQQLDQLEEAARDALAKAAWDHAWSAAALHALAEICARAGEWPRALEHIEASLRANGANNRATNLRALLLRRLGRDAEARSAWHALLAVDPLDAWARHIAGQTLRCDSQTRLDLAHDYARAGFDAEALDVLDGPESRRGDLPDAGWGAAPLVAYTRAWLRRRSTGDNSGFAAAAALPTDYCFPARLEEIAVLEAARAANPRDPRAPYYLGNLLYDRCRHEEAIRLWELAAKLDPTFPTVWRNLGIGYFNARHRPGRARAAYEHAFRADPADARLLYERDQLWKRLGRAPARRLRELEKHLALVRRRDDLSVELSELYNQVGRHGDALALLRSRRFQPWEGGEGLALGQHVRAHLGLGRAAALRREWSVARTHFEAALTAPENLGEARHLLANQSDVHFELGNACQGLGDARAARRHWRNAATFKGDFQQMSARAFSEMTFYSALAWRCLGQAAQADRLLRQLLDHARHLKRARARLDYFATSLPTMLLFEDDLQRRQETTALFLEAQARLGLGQTAPGLRRLRSVLERDPNHPLAPALLAEFGRRGNSARNSGLEPGRRTAPMPARRTP